MANYTTVNDLKAFKVNGELVDLVAFTDEEILAAIEEAEQLIEQVTGDWFYEKAMTVYLDGNGEYELFTNLDVASRCLAVTSVQYVDVDGTTDLETYTENEDFKRYDYYLRMVHLNGTSIRRGLSGAGKWPRGEKNIKVVGTFGNTPTPAVIVRATKLLSLEMLTPGLGGISSSSDVSQVQWPDFMISFKGGESRGQYPSSGYPEIDRMLQLYVNMSGLFQVVPDHHTTHTGLSGD